MGRQICWIEKLAEDVTREVRVDFFAGRIKWQFRRSDHEGWDYDTPPLATDWAQLEAATFERYRRRRVPVKQLELVRAERRAAGA